LQGKPTASYIRHILRSMQELDYIKPEDLPNIDLYMDQVTTFMDEHLKSTKRYPDDKLLTKTMINNYTKNNLLPSPNKKKYSKEHMLLLIFIYYFKNVLSISDIQSIFNPLVEHFYEDDSEVSLEDIYSEIFSFQEDQAKSLIRDVLRKYRKSQTSFTDIEDEDDQFFLQTFTFICMLIFDVYIKLNMVETIIDDTLNSEE